MLVVDFKHLYSFYDISLVIKTKQYSGLRGRQEPLLSPVLPPSKIQVFSPCSIHVAFTAKPHPLIKSDGSHWLQMKPISSHLTELEVQEIPVFVIPVLRPELLSSICHMIHHFLMQYN